MQVSLLLYWAGLSAPAIASTWVVDPEPGGFATIQSAIDTAIDGDVIQVMAGTYSESLDFTGKSLQLIGMDGAADTIITGEEREADVPLIRFTNGETPSAVMSGFTVHGAGHRCIAIEESSPTLSDLIISSCGDHVTLGTSTSEFGGMLVDAGSPTLDQLTFTDNRGELGAAIRLRNDSSVVISNSSFSGGVATHGGAIHITDGDLLLETLTFSENTAIFGHGGALYATGADLEVMDIEVTNGTATYNGGALALTDGTAWLQDIILTANLATYGDGGGLYISGTTIVNLSGVVASDNVSGGHGGAASIHLTDTSLSISGITAERNNATSSGGALQLVGGRYYINDATLIDNSTDGTGGAVVLPGPGALQMQFSQVEGNQAGADGGGLALGEADTPLSNVVVNTTLFADNRAGEHGGGARIYASSLNSSECHWRFNQSISGSGGALSWAGTTAILDANQVLGNSAWNGGGFYLDMGSDLALSASVFQENTGANTAGGALISGSGTAQILNNDFLGNQSLRATGVGNLAVTGASARVTNNIIAWASLGTGLSLDGGSALASTVAYNNVYANASSDYAGEVEDLTGTSENISADPWFISLSFNLDFDDDDLHLSHGSPCADAGDPSITSEDGSRSDIGAFPVTSDPAMDEDADGYVDTVDCDDTDAAVHPDAEEICNEIDDDCDGDIDEGCPDDTGDDDIEPGDTGIVHDTGDTADTADTGDTGHLLETGQPGGEVDTATPEEPSVNDTADTADADRGPPGDPSPEESAKPTKRASGCGCSNAAFPAPFNLVWLVTGLLVGYRRRNAQDNQ